MTTPVTPPTITPAPTPAPQRGDRATFSSRVDAFVLWLTSAVAEFSAVATNVYNNALEAYNSATSAAANAGSALASKDSAAASAASATNSALVATNAANSPTYTGTSTSTLTITIPQTVVVSTQAGRNWSAGMDLRLYNSIGNEMTGTVTDYTGTNLTMDIKSIKGSGTYSSWVIGYVSVDVKSEVFFWNMFDS